MRWDRRTPPLDQQAAGHRAPPAPANERRRSLVVVAAMSMCFLSVCVQLMRLSASGGSVLTLAAGEAQATGFARPDIVDRNGRLIATDIETPSLFADPSLVIDANEVVEKLSEVFSELDTVQLRRQLSDKSRRFVWIRRGLSPKVAQRVHDLGLPGLAFRGELKRAYPAGNFAGHALGYVDIDNKGVIGLEKHIDTAIGVEAVHGAARSDRAPVRLSLDMGVQHAVEDELSRAIRRYGAESASGIVLDVTTGEVLGAASLPGVDPARPVERLDAARADRIGGGTYELGSIFKMVTLALAFESGRVSPETIIDVTEPIIDGQRTIRDPHPAGRPLTVSEIFVRSSNVGSARLALDAGSEAHLDLLKRLRLAQPLATEAGPIATPQTPWRWEKIEQITVAYGHGIAVSPLQFAAGAAALVNGGEYVQPTFLRRPPGESVPRERVVSARTSRWLNEALRANVTQANGTGRRAEAAGYKVGGKTGTAEIAIDGSYRKDKVISSFLAAFPMDRPRYVVLVSLFEPKPTQETDGEIAASVNAAPSAGRLISRIAPLLGVLPEGTVAALED